MCIRDRCISDVFYRKRDVVQTTSFIQELLEASILTSRQRCNQLDTGISLRRGQKKCGLGKLRRNVLTCGKKQRQHRLPSCQRTIQFRHTERHMVDSNDFHARTVTRSAAL